MHACMYVCMEAVMKSEAMVKAKAKASHHHVYIVYT